MSYGLTLCGLVLGLLLARAPTMRFAGAPLLALPVAAAGALLLAAAGALLPAIARLLGPRLLPVAGAAALFALGALAGVIAARERNLPRIKRGARLVGARRARRGAFGDRSTLCFAGQRVPHGDETKHFKLIGTTGTGKTTAIRGLIGSALARADRVIIADPDGSYASRFYNRERGDRLLNPFDARSVGWDLQAELKQPQDGDQVARALIPDHAGEDRAWRGYARVFTAATLRQLHRARKLNAGTLHRLLTAAPVEEVRELLAETAAAPFLSAENARFFASVRAITTTYTAVLEHLECGADRELLSVRDWVRASGAALPAALFLTYRASQIATLRNVVSTWMRLAIFEALELPERDHRLWFVVDELDALGAIDGLKDALARLRKFGGRCVLGFQSIAQVSGLYGTADAQTIIENCGNTLLLRCSASENGGTARFASRLIGEREIIREQVTRSQHGAFDKPQRSTTTSLQHVTESAVLPAEIEQLPDLTGYLKFASVPEWTLTTIPPD